MWRTIKSLHRWSLLLWIPILLTVSWRWHASFSRDYLWFVPAQHLVIIEIPGHLAIFKNTDLFDAYYFTPEADPPVPGQFDPDAPEIPEHGLFHYTINPGTTSTFNHYFALLHFRSTSGFARNTDPPGWSLRIPFWPLFLLCLVPILSSSLAILQKFRRPKPGHCPKCSYDLRASPTCCPECGTPATPLSPTTNGT